MDRALAVEKLRTARRCLDAAHTRAQVIFPDERGTLATVDALTAEADAELSAACRLLSVPEPPVELIPTAPPPRRWEGLRRGTLDLIFDELRAWRVRRWIRRRGALVDRLLAAHDS